MSENFNRNVLVVEDDDGLRRLIIKNLNRTGYNADGVENGAQAFEKILKCNDCVVLLDQQLPDMTGREVIQKLQEYGVKIPFIIMTGHGDERLAVEMMKLGASDYLIKDIDFTDMLNGVLDRVFKAIETEKKLKQTEDALKSSELKLRSLFAAMPDLIIVLDISGKIIEIAPTSLAEQTANISDIIGNNINTILPTELADTFLSIVDEVINKDIHHTIDYFMPVGGNTLCFSATISPLNDELVLWVARDITDRKLAELEIIELNETLEQKVQKRTAELNQALNIIEESNIELKHLNESIAGEARTLLYLNEKLANSEQQLKAANIAKDKFLSIISHDIRNPITALLLSAEFLYTFQDKMSEEQRRNSIEGVYTSSVNLAELVDNLLTWAKTQNENMEFNPIDLNINQLIENCIKSLASNITQKDIKLEFIPSKNFYIYADENMIKSIINNLLTNAIKFTYRGGLIEIGIENFSSDNNPDVKYMKIYVKDSGIGINKDKLSKLFIIGEKISQKGTEGESSSGLGLILCKEFIEKHNGRIWAESVPGMGSTFFIEMPI